MCCYGKMNNARTFSGSPVEADSIPLGGPPRPSLPLQTPSSQVLSDGTAHSSSSSTPSNSRPLAALSGPGLGSSRNGLLSDSALVLSSQPRAGWLQDYPGAVVPFSTLSHQEPLQPVLPRTQEPRHAWPHPLPPKPNLHPISLRGKDSTRDPMTTTSADKIRSAAVRHRRVEVTYTSAVSEPYYLR